VEDAGIGEYIHPWAKVCLSILQLQMLLLGAVDFSSTNEVEVLINISQSNATAHCQLNGGGYSRSPVGVGVVSELA
jgi:hypothetical protein